MGELSFDLPMEEIYQSWLFNDGLNRLHSVLEKSSFSEFFSSVQWLQSSAMNALVVSSFVFL